MVPLLDGNTAAGLIFGWPAWLKWLLSHFHIGTSAQPVGPVLLDLRLKQYLVVEVKLGRGFKFSIDLRD